jgi:hypothetical protein
MDLWKKIEMSGSGEPGFFFTNDKDWGMNPCISGNALITVCDHGIDGGLGIPYKVPMKMLVEIVNATTLPPCALSYNELTGQREWKQITAAALTRKNAQVLKITYGNNTVTCTPDHKIFTKNRGWVEAQNLCETDILVEE